jgi:hypothetical protein
MVPRGFRRIGLAALVAVSISTGMNLAMPPQPSHAAGAWVMWTQDLGWLGPVPGVVALAHFACNQELNSAKANWRSGIAAAQGIPQADVLVTGVCQYKGPSISIRGIGVGLTWYKVILTISCPCGQPTTIYRGGGGGRGSVNDPPQHMK